MPFVSESQRRKFYAMANRGEISKKKVKEWEDATPDKKLPERVDKTAELFMEMGKNAARIVATEAAKGIGKRRSKNTVEPLEDTDSADSITKTPVNILSGMK